MTSERLSALALACVPRVGPVGYRQRLAAHPSAADALAAIGPESVRDEALRAAEDIIESAAAAGAELSLLGDPDYPAALHDLSDPPPFIATLGSRRVLERPLAAIVGTRQSTAYGERTAARIARALVERGVGIVSGMARGIDAAAHRAALDAGGETIAVLGGGVDVPYPSSHAVLHAAIVRAGLILSERPCGERAGPGAFPRRNRLIAALARATIVVEAGLRSGARLTADAANELSRPVGAVPGPIDAEQCAGTNMMLRDGAIVIASVDDAIALVGAEAPGAAPGERATSDPDRLRLLQQDGECTGPVLRAIHRGARSIDALVDATTLSPRDVLGAVSALELRGLVRRDASGFALF
jgi:DNA processing protein